MKIFKKVSWIVFLFLLMCPMSVLAQEEETPLIKTKKFRELELKRGLEQAQKLSKGVLVVRLTSNSRKITALESLLRDHPEHKRYRKQLKKTKDKTLELQKETVAAYMDNYLFSDVCFIMDYDMKKLSEGVTKGLFVNELLEKDSTIDVTGRDVFFSYVGHPSANTSTRSLLITDNKNHLIPKPFPYSTLFATSLDKILIKSDAKIIEEAVKRQEEALKKFYVRATSRLNKRGVQSKVPKEKELKS